MKAKSLLESKTFWIACLQAIIGGIIIFQGAYPTLGELAIAKSMLDIFLRIITESPIK